MNITDEQWEGLLAAAGPRAGAITQWAVAEGLIESSRPVETPREPPAMRTTETQYEPQSNVATEGADAEIVTEEGGEDA